MIGIVVGDLLLKNNLNLDNMKLIPIRDKNLKLDGGAMFGVVPKVIWRKVYPADENNLCNWAMRCLLVDTGDRKVLIDNGVGDKQDEKFFKHYYLNGDFSIEKELQKNGYSFEDITDVVLTHLHFDHCGGSVYYDENRELKLTYPNADYWISEKQWNWAVNPNRREKASFLKENILPIQDYGKLQLVKEDEKELFPGFVVKQYHGHTDGQLIPHIQYKGKTIAYMGSFLPSTAHIPMPWVMSYDTRPLLTLEDKKRFFKEAIEEDYILFFEHDLYYEACTLKETEKGIRLDKTFTLQEYFNE